MAYCQMCADKEVEISTLRSAKEKAEAALCRAREALKIILSRYQPCTCTLPAWPRSSPPNHKDTCNYAIIEAALSSPAPCPHEEEAKRLEEAGEGVARIAAERARQKAVEGWTPEHDWKHGEGELAIAAACYAINHLFGVQVMAFDRGIIEEAWPWSEDWDKRDKHDRLRSLAIAGALIAAELDRTMAELRRAGEKEG